MSKIKFEEIKKGTEIEHSVSAEDEIVESLIQATKDNNDSLVCDIVVKIDIKNLNIERVLLRKIPTLIGIVQSKDISTNKTKKYIVLLMSIVYLKEYLKDLELFNKTPEKIYDDLKNKKLEQFNRSDYLLHEYLNKVEANKNKFLLEEGEFSLKAELIIKYLVRALKIIELLYNNIDILLRDSKDDCCIDKVYQNLFQEDLIEKISEVVEKSSKIFNTYYDHYLTLNQNNSIKVGGIYQYIPNLIKESSFIKIEGKDYEVTFNSTIWAVSKIITLSQIFINLTRYRNDCLEDNPYRCNFNITDHRLWVKSVQKCVESHKDIVKKTQDNLVAIHIGTDIDLLQDINEEHLDLYRGYLSREKDHTNWLVGKINDFKKDKASFEDRLNKLLNNELGLTIQELDSIKNSLQKVMDVICELTKIECMLHSVIGTVDKTIKSFDATVKNVSEAITETANSLKDFKVATQTSVGLKIEGVTRQTYKQNIKERVLEQVNNQDPMYDKVLEAYEEVSDTLIDQGIATYKQTFIDCLWDNGSTSAEASIKEFFDDANNNLDNCGGNSLINLPKISGLDLGALLTKLSLYFNLTKPRCKK